MKRILAIIVVLMASTTISAQHIFSGTGGDYLGRIYEDGMMNDGTRYIISDMRVLNTYTFSLCKFIPSSGEPWYGLAVESKEFIPTNGLLVFVCGDKGDTKTFILGQSVSDNAIAQRETIGINPVFFFGGANSLALSLYAKTVHSEVSYAIYDLSSEVLEQLLSASIKEIRISSRSTYKKIKDPIRTFSKWMEKAKDDVDIRSGHSLNMILEGIYE